MFHISDIKLALACINAGIVPGLIAYPDIDVFLADVKTCKKHCDEIFGSINLTDLIRNDIFKRIIESGITHIELLDYNKDQISNETILKIKLLRSHNIKIYIKCLSHKTLVHYLKIIDGVTIKGPEGAGRSLADVSLIDEISKIKELYPNLEIIASGGVKNNFDIKKLMQAGAHAVSIGTLFALSKESSMPEETKIKLLTKTSADISRTKHGAKQRAIIFQDTEFDGDPNNTFGLTTGLKSGTTGHVFMGNAISEVNKILPIIDIVTRITYDR